MTDNNFSFFLNNQEDLFSRYPQKYVIIKSETVVKVANSYEEAFLYAMRNHMEQGSYIIQETAKRMSDIAENFYSLNVSFK